MHDIHLPKFIPTLFIVLLYTSIELTNGTPSVKFHVYQVWVMMKQFHGEIELEGAFTSSLVPVCNQKQVKVDEW